jgi:hypothetical protein
LQPLRRFRQHQEQLAVLCLLSKEAEGRFFQMRVDLAVELLHARVQLANLV